jgi:peptidoglycan/LPS O-acetylase OafA/YrhL
VDTVLRVAMTGNQRAVSARRSSGGRVAVLDGLRLLAATMVVGYHYIAAPSAKLGSQQTVRAEAWGVKSASLFPHWLHNVAGFGWTGVELFFLISGFVICMSGWGRRPADFFVSRVVRLVPAYWAATLITTIVLVAWPKLSGGVQPSIVLANMTMVQSAYGVVNFVPAYWTLLVELTFYLLFGIVAIGGITYRRMVTFCVLWSIASIIAVTAHDPLFKLIINPLYSAYFVAGIAFFLIYKFGGNLLLWGIVVYSWLISVNEPRLEAPWQLTLVISAMFVVMALVATHKLDRVQWRWLTVAGALTYPLYLIHQDIGFTIFSYLSQRMPATLLVVLVYLAMLGLAWVIHRTIERPVAPLLKAKLSEAVAKVRASGPRSAPVLARLAGAGMAGPAANGAAANGAAANGAAANGAAANGVAANGVAERSNGVGGAGAGVGPGGGMGDGSAAGGSAAGAGPGGSAGVGGGYRRAGNGNGRARSYADLRAVRAERSAQEPEDGPVGGPGDPYETSYAEHDRDEATAEPEKRAMTGGRAGRLSP